MRKINLGMMVFSGLLVLALQAEEKPRPYVVTESRSSASDPPVLIVVDRDTRIDADRLFDAANREFLRRRIAEIKGYIAKTEASAAGRLRQELESSERLLSSIQAGSGPLRGLQYVTVFESADHFVVAYFEDTTWDHFVCAISKKEYQPLRPDRWKAVNLTQKSVTLH